MVVRAVAVLIIAGFTLLHAASIDTLSGTVKDGSGAAVAGAAITLVEQSELSSVTDDMGEFSILVPNSGIAVPYGISIDNTPQIGIRGRQLQFRLKGGCNNAVVSLFRGSGQLISKVTMGSLTTDLQRHALPELASGYYILQIAIDGFKTNLSLISTGRDCFIDNVKSGVSARSTISAAAAEVVDTLVASKEGYITAKVAIESYATKNVAIVLEEDGPVVCQLSDLPEPSALQENKKLPNPFAFFDGTEITKKSQWPCLRKEILNMAYKYMYGQMPPFEAPDVEIEGSVSSSGVTAKITYNGKSETINFSTSGSGEILLISMGGGIEPGSNYPHRTTSINNTKLNGWKKICNTLFGMSPCGEIAIGWGCNILCRAIADDPDAGIDTNKIMTTGCSNTAKAAFLAGVFCEGIDLTVPVESGGFGAASPRVAEYFAHGPGDWICVDEPQGLWRPDYGDQWLAEPYMDADVASWVIENNSGNVYKLPYDHHMLMACIAPRALVVCSNDNGPNSWCHLNGTGSAVAAWAAEPVFNALGVPKQFAFSIPDAYTHCMEAKQNHGDLVNEFFKRVFDGDENAETDVLNIPSNNVQDDPSDWESIWVDWDMEKTLE